MPAHTHTHADAAAVAVIGVDCRRVHGERRKQTVQLTVWVLLKLLQLKLVSQKLAVAVLRERRSRVRRVRVRSKLSAKATAHTAAVGLIEVGNVAHIVMHIAAAGHAHAHAIATRHARASVEKGQTRIRVELRLQQARELLLVDGGQRQSVRNHALDERKRRTRC